MSGLYDTGDRTEYRVRAKVPGSKAIPAVSAVFTFRSVCERIVDEWQKKGYTDIQIEERSITAWSLSLMKQPDA